MQALKFLLAAFALVTYMLLSGFVWILPFVSHWQKRRLCGPLLCLYCRWLLKLLSFRVDVKPPVPHPPGTGRLLVGNHLSYMDILIVGAQQPAIFVTSQEMKETPFLGLICRTAGCFFVERRNKHNVLSEIREITTALKNGFNLVIFPEATSTNGEQVLEFKKPLFTAAVASRSWVQPFCLNYKKINSKKLSSANKDVVFWYGDMPFIPHLWRMAGMQGIEVELSFLEVLNGAEVKAATLAELSQAQVTASYLPIPNSSKTPPEEAPVPQPL